MYRTHASEKKYDVEKEKETRLRLDKYHPVRMNVCARVRNGVEGSDFRCCHTRSPWRTGGTSGTVEARNVAATVQVVHLGDSEADRLALTHGVVIRHR
jgi:hypothetical protein